MSQARMFLLSFVIFVGVCYVGLTWFVNSEVEKGLNNSVAETEGLTLTFTDLSVSIVDRCVSLKDVEATLPQGQHLTADEVRITSFDQLNPIPHYMIAEATGVNLDASSSNAGAWEMFMQALDIETIRGDISLDYEYDPKDMTLNLNHLTIKSPELADLQLSGILDGLDLKNLQIEKFFGLRIGPAKLTFSNYSLVDRLLQTMATGLNISRTDTLTLVSTELRSMAEYAGKNEKPIAENALLGLDRYLNDPGFITITTKPVEPIPLLYFFMGRDIYDNLHALKIDIKTDSSDNI